MHTPSVPGMLAVWERGLQQGWVERALTLLQAACPDRPVEELAQLSIGRRDAGLLSLREWAFGSRLASLARCPACGETLEINLTLGDLRRSSPDDGIVENSLTVGDCEVQFRVPNSNDLAACADLDVAGVRQQLLARCLISAASAGQRLTADRLPEPVMDGVMEQMAAADPQADVQFEVACPACGHRWREVFDIVSFLWTETDAWARRTLKEVHILASTYSWPERDILNLSPLRRQLYLEMAGA